MYVLGVYKRFAVEVTPNMGASNAVVRVCPLPGQGIPTSMFVECSRPMRNKLTDDVVAIVRGKVTSRGGGTPFLYSYFREKYELITRKEAEAMIANGELGFPED